MWAQTKTSFRRLRATDPAPSKSNSLPNHWHSNFVSCPRPFPRGNDRDLSGYTGQQLQNDSDMGLVLVPLGTLNGLHMSNSFLGDLEEFKGHHR